MRLVLYFIVLLIEASLAWRFFNRGRSAGGNVGVPGGPSLLSGDFPEKWFVQKLDHFDPTNTETWSQRYYLNEAFYDRVKGGPVFLMIGGEGEASAKWMSQGAWITYAKRYKALCFQLEHRYYGKSRPTNDLTTKNLQYLTSQQALADLAYFITAKTADYSLTGSKWFVFGGSYPGSLAAWMRLKYPYLVHAAVSSSGPLLAQVDFKGYFKVVNDALASHSVECVDSVNAGTLALAGLLQTPDGRRYLDLQFRVCDPLGRSDSDDITNFYETLSSNFAGVVQYNLDNRMGGGGTTAANVTIDAVCTLMTDGRRSPVERLAAVNSLILHTYAQKCLDYRYAKMIDELRASSWASEIAEGGRQWYYQTCTEFGFFQTTADFPVDFFVRQCVDVFGSNFNRSLVDGAAERTNILYGALGSGAENVVYVHGSVDPWHVLGITKSGDNRAPAIYIEGTAHCANMYPEADTDLPQLKIARAEISNYIYNWL